MIKQIRVVSSGSTAERSLLMFAVITIIGAVFGIMAFSNYAKPVDPNGYMFGVALGASLAALAFYAVASGKASVQSVSKIGALALMAAMVAFKAHPAFAQTAVPLEIPTNVIFSETNNWLETFAPIAAIGIGISIALAVLGYLGKMIVSAFRG